MKLNKTSEQTISVSGAVGQTVAFKMDFNDKMFRVLTDGLYTKKVEAVIRELTCNALDSHHEAGKNETPIDVHLPTLLEPYFYVEDYGVGLDHEGIINLYTTVGASSKDHTNELIGAYGLGSKSPFAYTTSFTVISRHNGMERVYNASVVRGMPHLTMIVEKKTSAGNGIRVQLPVKETDFREFKRVASYIFTYFPVKPNIVGGEVDVSQQIEYEFSNDRIGLRNSERRIYGSTKVVCGVVAYDFDVNNAESWIERQRDLCNDDDQRLIELSTLERVYNSGSIDVFVNLGDVDIPPSRESVEYTETTFEFLFSSEMYNAVIAVADSIIDSYSHLTVWQRSLEIKKSHVQFVKLCRKNVTNDERQYGFGGKIDDCCYALCEIYGNKAATDISDLRVISKPGLSSLRGPHHMPVSTDMEYFLILDVPRTYLSKCVRAFALAKKIVDTHKIALIAEETVNEIGIPTPRVYKASAYMDNAWRPSRTGTVPKIKTVTGSVTAYDIKHNCRFSFSHPEAVLIDRTNKAPIYYAIRARNYADAAVVCGSDEAMRSYAFSSSRTSDCSLNSLAKRLNPVLTTDCKVVVLGVKEYKQLYKATDGNLKKYGWHSIDVGLRAQYDELFKKHNVSKTDVKEFVSLTSENDWKSNLYLMYAHAIIKADIGGEIQKAAEKIVEYRTNKERCDVYKSILQINTAASIMFKKFDDYSVKRWGNITLYINEKCPLTSLAPVYNVSDRIFNELKAYVESKLENLNE